MVAVTPPTVLRISALLLAACGPKQHAEAPTLAGRWKVQLDVDESLRTPEALGRRAEGTIWLHTSPDSLAPKYYFGPFDIDFRPLGHPGLVGTTDSVVPIDACQERTGAITALGRQIDSDSVEITIGACIGHGYVSLAGRRQGSTIKGTWAIVSSGGAKGHFSMSIVP